MSLTAASIPVELHLKDPEQKYRASIELADTTKWWAKRGEFNWQHASFTLPAEHELLRESYGGYTLRERCIGWGLEVTRRGRTFADVALVIKEEEDVAPGKSKSTVGIDATFEGVGWTDWFLSGREVMSSVLARYKNDKLVPTQINDFIADLGADNVDNSRRPTLYALAGGDRTDFGPFDVAVEVEGTSVHQLTVLRIDHGRSLRDTMAELCREFDCTMSGVWGGTGVHGLPLYTIFVHGQRGQDLSTGPGKVVFSREFGTLIKAKFKEDWTLPRSFGEAKGKGTRERQKVGYTKNNDLYDIFGNREGPEVWDSAWDGSADELTREQLWLMANYGVAFRWMEAEIQENEDEQVQGVHFDVEDIHGISDEAMGISEVQRLTELEIRANSPAVMFAVFGRRPPKVSMAGTLLGKGGFGDRRHGYHAWPVRGEPEVFQNRCYESGEQVFATQANGSLQNLPDPDAPLNPIHTRGVNNGEGELKVGQGFWSSCGCEMADPPPPDDQPINCTATATVTLPAESERTVSKQLKIHCAGIGEGCDNCPEIGEINDEGDARQYICLVPGQVIGQVQCPEGCDPIDTLTYRLEEQQLDIVWTTLDCADCTGYVIIPEQDLSLTPGLTPCDPCGADVVIPEGDGPGTPPSYCLLYNALGGLTFPAGIDLCVVETEDVCCDAIDWLVDESKAPVVLNDQPVVVVCDPVPGQYDWTWSGDCVTGEDEVRFGVKRPGIPTADPCPGGTIEPVPCPPVTRS